MTKGYLIAKAEVKGALAYRGFAPAKMAALGNSCRSIDLLLPPSTAPVEECIVMAGGIGPARSKPHGVHAYGSGLTRH